MTSIGHHLGLGSLVGQIERDLESGILILAVRVEHEAINAEKRGRLSSGTSGQGGYTKFIAEGFLVIAHRPVTICDGSNFAFAKWCEGICITLWPAIFLGDLVQ